MPTEYLKGVFVVNEGPFGGTGTISWYNPETGEVQDSLYEKANNGAELGQFVQSLTFYNGKGYIIVSKANRVVIVDATTFRYIGTIEGLEQPRFFLPVGNYAYISQWGNDGLSGSLARVDLATNNLIDKIPVGKGPEKMILDDAGHLYVAHSGGFGTDSTLAEIDAQQGKLIRFLNTGGLNPATLAYRFNHLFALCRGNYDPQNPKGNVLGDVNPVSVSVDVPGGSDDLVASADKNTLYFAGGGKVWAYDGTGLHALFDQETYGLGYDPEEQLLYCADPKSFSSNGEVSIRKFDGTELGKFRTGVAPGELLIVH